MRKSSFSQSLATVNSHSSSQSGSQNSSSVVPAVTPRMKRSPYLSSMTSAGNNNGGEDLVELLSRPKNQSQRGVVGNSGGAGGEGGLQFFQLKRPSSSAVNNNDIATSGSGDVQMNVTSTTKNLPSTNNTTSKSNLKSALRINSNLQLSSVPSTTTTTSTPQAGEGMKKNTSVTFSRNTKHPSRLGMQDSTVNDGGSGGNDHFPVLDRPSHTSSGVGGSSGLSGVGMMRKSQSICAPEYLLSHSTDGGVKSGGDGGNAATNVSSSGGGGGEGNASFPIYFAKLGDGSSSQHPPQEQSVQSSLQNQSSTPPPPPSTSSNEQIRRKSKSMSTLQYSYNQQLLSTHPTNNSNTSNTNTTTNKLFGALGINPSSRVNLKFRDMLDEGDGNEGDLNLRLRNQQWKDFRLFSKELESGNPMLASIEELNGGGSCRNVTDDEDGGVDVGNEKDGGGGVQSSSSTTSLAGSKRAISPSSSSQNPSSRTSAAAASFLNSFGSQHRQLNSHRASVSVNDLAMLRRSAARMRVVPSPSSSNSSSSNGNFGPTQMAPGATLGGEMLSRISSKNSMSTIPSSNSSVTSVGSNTAALSPLAQMMAKSANLSSSKQQDLFSSRVNSSRPSSQMGRRVHTVGAGLAYGGPNLSRFDLGSLRKDLSIMSGGSGSSGGGGKNEEWDL